MHKDTTQVAARFAWPPFVARLLAGGHLRTGRTVPLPFDAPDSLTLEGVEAVAEITKRGAWAFLCRHGGWRRRRYAANDGRVREGRLWHTELPPLEFSPTTLRLLLQVYNEIAADVPPYRQAPELQHNGDIFLDHAVFRRLEGRQPRVESGAGASNPLTLLTHGQTLTPPENLEAELQRLLVDDIQPFLRWLADDWTEVWLALDTRRWQSLKTLTTSCRRQTQIWNAWIQVCGLERPDLLVPCLAFWERVAGEERWRGLARAAEDLTADALIRQRQARLEPWLSWLGVVDRLAEVAAQVRRLHPIDREGVHQIFLTACGEHQLDTVQANVRQLIQSFRPTIG